MTVTCGALWGPVGPCGALWGPVGPCGALWGPVGSVTTSDKDGRDVQCLLRLSSVNSGLGTT